MWFLAFFGIYKLFLIFFWIYKLFLGLFFPISIWRFFWWFFVIFCDFCDFCDFLTFFGPKSGKKGLFSPLESGGFFCDFFQNFYDFWPILGPSPKSRPGQGPKSLMFLKGPKMAQKCNCFGPPGTPLKKMTLFFRGYSKAIRAIYNPHPFEKKVLFKFFRRPQILVIFGPFWPFL